MSTLAIWCRVVQSRDVRSRVFSRPLFSSAYCYSYHCQFNGFVAISVVQLRCSLMAVMSHRDGHKAKLLKYQRAGTARSTVLNEYDGEQLSITSTQQ